MNLTFVYVAIVYAAFIAGLRRYDDRLRIGVAILFYLLVAAFLFESLLGQSVDLPADFLGKLQPWTTVFPDDGTINGALNDVVLQFVPWSHEVREAWKSLHFPLWNESVGGGYPLLANAQSSALSLLRIISLPLGLGESFAAEAAFKMLLALTFGYLWARRRDLSEPAAIVTAICFGFSMGLHAWLHFPHSTTAAMIPAIFYAIDRLVLDERPSGVVLVTIVFTVTLLAGHPETAAHAISFSGLWFFFVVFTERRERWRQSLIRMSLACVFALLLASPFLVPFLEALPRSLRMDALRHGLDVSTPHRSPELFILMLHGGFFGRVGDDVWGPVHPEFASAFAGMIAVAGFIAVLAHLIMTRRWRSPLAFFALSIPLVLMAIFSVPPVSIVMENLPPFSVAANGRLRLVLCWLAAVCAGALIDLIRRRRLTGPVIGALAVVGALVIAFSSNESMDEIQRRKALLTAIPGVLSIAAVFMFSGPRWMKIAAPALTAALVTIDLWLPSRGFNPELPKRYLYPDTPLTLRLQDLSRNDPLGPVKIIAPGAVFFPNSAALYGLEDMRAHDPMANARMLGFLRVFADYDSGSYFAMLRRIDHPVLDFMNVRYLITGGPIDTEGFTEVYRGPDGWIWRNDQAMPRFRTATGITVVSNREELHERLLDPASWSGGAIVEQELEGVIPASSEEIPGIERKGAGDYRIWTNPPERRLIVTSLPWWPGWRVRSKGTTLDSVRVNGGFLGIVVPAGTTRIKLTYRPLSFQIGLALFLAGLIALILYVRRAGRIPAGGCDRLSVPGAPKAILSFLLITVLSMTGCGKAPPFAGDSERFPAYPGAVKLDEMTDLFNRAHRIMNPEDTEQIELMLFETRSSVDKVATWYAEMYGLGSVAEDQVNDFSAIPPRAYYRSGDLAADARQIEPLLEALDLEIDVDAIEGTYRGAHIDPVYKKPRVTLQRPYVDPVRGEVVDRTLILLVYDWM